MNGILERLVIARTLRVPVPEGGPGAGAAAARQFDAALMSAGFKLSRDLMERLSGMDEGAVLDTAVRVLATVRTMAGDHVRHNVYFRRFPRKVPGTVEFWARCMQKWLLDPVSGDDVRRAAAQGALNLLDFPDYGRYLHTYEEMLAAHDDLIASAKDRVTVLHLGGSLDREIEDLYVALAGSVTPLDAADLEALRLLAEHCAGGRQPDAIPVRENRAVVNLARLNAGLPLLLDTVTDVLRLACALSDGDVTLAEPTRFRSPRRPLRRALLAGLDEVVRDSPAKLGDVGPYREEWKRLGERLHPHEHPAYPYAADVFAVARGEKAARSFAGRVEVLVGAGDVAGAARLLSSAPGMLFRSADRLLRTAESDRDRDAVFEALEAAAGGASGRVVLSLREHLLNRLGKPGRARVFANRLGRGAVVPDARPPLGGDVRKRLAALLDGEIARRLPEAGHLLVDPDVLDVALPMSGKAAASGLGVLPRGSMSPVEGELLRFFVYWKQARHTTDFDLSALMLDGDFLNPAWLSYTSLTQVGGAHSGDITAAPDGASEFIDLRLGEVRARVIIPQVNVYSGEGFEQVAESFFGFMLRGAEQEGRPFEPRTVRMKSDLRGAGRVALPLAFLRGDDGRWRAKWLHLFLRGRPAFNQVEGNRVTTAALVRAVAERRYLTVRYLTGLWASKGGTIEPWDGGRVPDGPVTFVGFERPEGLHEESRVFTPENLRDIVPA
ncbi:TerD family protein [Actinomadura montaniterrae]|uniref:TerD family protein n=1 Tax=Actinomadura montaniterrae TaxID=1803903 RepID=A0A6L3VK82_9ACTN|nr:TerD family protein [Actinomadura montaniterrae]KAB2368202.1 TerD family protein [Actinomadura montaniterrae]